MVGGEKWESVAKLKGTHDGMCFFFPHPPSWFIFMAKRSRILGMIDEKRTTGWNREVRRDSAKDRAEDTEANRRFKAI